ncbi:hypothetical protein KFZ70_16385 [Tamlana fucoidanivorans]|uniref:DinB family protein n=1 Tax=Allotamlana fucoidanivorans TaxID=2583814 RepID=A0A5C4SHQ7_9FLAO|nr:hypothetical protein [Tamlana fucoidanivorans]TNJ42882.1 hypothetical protein FGF67_12905 [Tamlana fucoidanivorans]
MKHILMIFSILTTLVTMGQNIDNLPYHEIPDYPETYTSRTVAARMIDGLGFRYYWATEGLTSKDLSYKSSESSRTSEEVLNHIYELSKFIRNSVLSDNKDMTEKEELFEFEEKRRQTLMNLKVVSEALTDTKGLIKLEDTEVPFWNMINGPIADAIWHCGQIVMLRRASGNPFNSKVSLFSGKLRN